MNTRGEGVDRSTHPLFQGGEGGSSPTSPLLLVVEEFDPARAAALNAAWHSALPQIDLPTVKGKSVAYSASFNGKVYAVALWSDPVAPSVDDGATIELRRFAIAPDAPKNTASRVLSIMRTLLGLKFGRVRLVSYQAKDIHSGTIYKASGWTIGNESQYSEWGTRRRRKRAAGFRVAPSTRKPSQIKSDKVRWEIETRGKVKHVRKVRAVKMGSVEQDNGSLF